MPTKKRFKTKYPGVYFIIGESVSGKHEKIYYIRYRKKGKMVEEKAGRQFQDDMTPSRASQVRTRRVEGNELSNKERRLAEVANKRAELGRWTIDRLFNAYIIGRPANKGRSVDKNRYINYIKPNFGNKEPKEILPLDVDRLRIQLLKKKSPQTVKHILNLLTWVINYGTKRNLCESISFHIEKPTVNNIITEDLSDKQLINLLDAIEVDSNIQVKNLMQLALFTGLRRGEMFKLKWEDIKFERGFIHIRDPKGGPDEQIPLNDAARFLLQSHPKTESPFVFPGRGGKQRVTAQTGVNRIKKRAGLPKGFRPLHGLRHVYASMLASSGKVDLYTLQKLLTHKDPRMTQRYAHLRDETLKRASNLGGNLIRDTYKNHERGKNAEKKSKSAEPPESSDQEYELSWFEENDLIIPPGLFRNFFDFKGHYHVAEKDPILISGDTGVGKSLFLQLTKCFFKEEYKKKKEKHPPIVEANCAHFAGGASDLNMSRSELFGHVKGAFSGAVDNKKGLIEEADEGLLILEELGELPLEVQAMLLTFIETGKFRRVGDNKTGNANVKIVGATNRGSSLRDDFRYRFFSFPIPPLKDRRDDIFYYLYEKFPDLTKALTKSEVLILLSYNWPGNVREIERIAKLLIRDKWVDDNLDTGSSFKSDQPYPYNLSLLDIRETGLDPYILERINMELPDYGVDMDLIESLLNKKRVGLLYRKDDYAFKELRVENNKYRSVFVEDRVKMCHEYKPFREAYEGYLAFCGLFLQDPLKDENILTDLKNCDFYKFDLNRLDFPKSKERRVHESAKAIMKYMKNIYMEDDKWPTDIMEFWFALKEIKEKDYSKRSLIGWRASEECIEEICSMNETDLLDLYYNELLQRTGGSIKFVAEMAGLKTNTLRERLKKRKIKYSHRKN